MRTRSPPAVYKCIIPVKKPLSTRSTVYHTLFGPPAEGRPFPAWPEVDDAYQPCCLPTLPDRGVYFHHHPISEELLDVAKRVVEYWNEVVEREIREQIVVLAKSNEISLWHRIELGGLPQVIFGTDHEKAFNLNMKLGNSAEYVVEAIVQGVIYGNLNNFFGAPHGDFLDAFAYVHELSHHFAGWLHGGRVLDELSKNNHKTLNILATEERLSRGEIAKLWREFWHTNEQIKTLVAKFEPIEEIYATYLGLRFLPTDVRHTVKPMIDDELRKRKWDKAYEAFAEACDNDQDTSPLMAASYISDCVCRLVESIDIDTASLLYEFSNIMKRIDDIDSFEIGAILIRAGVPAEILRAVSKAYDNYSSGYGLQDLLLKGYMVGPQVWLIGRYSENVIHPTFYELVYESDYKPDYKDNLSLRARIFYESIRQQLSKHCGFVSPFPHEFKEEMQILYTRLPKEYKKYFNKSNRDSVYIQETTFEIISLALNR
jgi:hypothetical protein